MALARCYDRSSGEIIYLTDADCLFDGEALARLLAPIMNEGEQVTTGRIVVEIDPAKRVDELRPADNAPAVGDPLGLHLL